ncbi:WD40/YVTN/BNR-like repeat-containing protein [Rheinheimera maricola]|uniref:Glycosyl hydrolase n=1 Tax=Rheinheimera maricola TaxID=2793282 RepID=A0ABS7XB04_9GAMM|nr:hypothetical protein [Rheinheimera maricola]MBZ9612745.1 hypothetical protein [Rheinheimera maricola]
MKLGNVLLWLLCWLALSACNGDTTPLQPPPVSTPEPFEFTHQGLDGLIIKRLYQQEDSILALTNNGLYQQQQQQNSWQLIGLEGYELQDLAMITDQHWLAAVRLQDATESASNHLQESFDAGASWLAVSRPFGEDGKHEGIYALHYDTLQQRLYATGLGVLAQSDNLGISWQKLQGDWDMLAQPNSALALAPDRSHIWWGGQGAIENGVLFSYRLADGHSQTFKALLPDPSVYYNLRFANNHVYACGEGGIVMTTNNGDSWINLLPESDHRFYFDIAMDPNSNGRLYTAGWDKKFNEPQPLILQWSDNAGQSWQRLHYQGPPDFMGGVRSMLLVQQQEQSYLYLGLYKGGMMKVRLE